MHNVRSGTSSYVYDEIISRPPVDRRGNGDNNLGSSDKVNSSGTRNLWGIDRGTTGGVNFAVKTIGPGGHSSTSGSTSAPRSAV